MNMRGKTLLLSVAFLAVPFGPFLFAQQEEPGAAREPTPSSLFDFFYFHQDSLPVLKIETDWGQLIRTKQEEPYQPGVLSCGEGGAIPVLNIQLRARGNTRKKVCRFPPVKVKPDKHQLKALGFSHKYKLKLVLPCQGGQRNEDCLLREALAYKLYEVASPIHFRTRLIELQCWENGREKHNFYAFLIEEEEELADRLNGRLLSKGEIRPNALERSLYLKVCFFQYMIANTDWSVANRHNLRFLQLPGYSRVVPVAYDFDYAGMVNTSYAIPGSALPIDDVSQRYFLGEEVTEKEALECAQFFLSRKDKILQECRSIDVLRGGQAESVAEFLADFFNILEDEELMIKAFVAPDDVD